MIHTHKIVGHIFGTNVGIHIRLLHMIHMVHDTYDTHDTYSQDCIEKTRDNKRAMQNNKRAVQKSILFA